jgi:hypothetical protein
LRHRQFADLIEEQGPAVRRDEASDARRHRTGERTAHVAKQLALHQMLGQSSAVDGHERSVCAAAGRVDGARHEFLAGATVAGDEHRAVGVTHALNHAEHAHQTRVLSEQVGRVKLAPILRVGNHRRRRQGRRPDRSGTHREGFQRRIDGREQRVFGERLEQITVDVAMQGELGAGLIIGGHHDHRRARLAVHAGEHLSRMPVGDLLVNQHDIDRSSFDRPQRGC